MGLPGCGEQYAGCHMGMHGGDEQDAAAAHGYAMVYRTEGMGIVEESKDVTDTFSASSFPAVVIPI